MAQITFYRQKRWDGGIHTGLATEHGTVLEQYQHGKGISDPALLWFVDVRAKGRFLPQNVEGIRKWFLDHADIVTGELCKLSEELTAGIDFNSLPLVRKVAGAPRGVRVSIVCSVTRRVDAREAARLLRDMADHWQEYIERLQSEDAMAH